MDAKQTATQGVVRIGARVPMFELLKWNPPLYDDLPDSNITMACWTEGDGFFSGYWDDGTGQWIDCATGGPCTDQNVTWANPKGPLALREIAPADVPLDQVRAALHEALELVRGWIEWKCPRKHKAEHLAVVGVLAEAGGVA